MTDYTEVVRTTAWQLGLIDRNGVLVCLDSHSSLELLAGLERATKLTIPTTSMRAESFASIETIATLLGQIAQRGHSTEGAPTRSAEGWATRSAEGGPTRSAEGAPAHGTEGPPHKSEGSLKG